jgi:hypothetical protein
VRESVIEEDIQLSNHTNAITAGAIDRHDRFYTQLGLIGLKNFMDSGRNPKP